MTKGACPGRGSRERQQRRRPMSGHTGGSGCADAYLHGPCTGR